MEYPRELEVIASGEVTQYSYSIAEMVAARSGLGFLIWNAWETFAVEQMYVGLFTIAIIGFAINLLLYEVERLIIPWKTA